MKVVLLKGLVYIVMISLLVWGIYSFFEVIAQNLKDVHNYSDWNLFVLLRTLML